MSATLPRRPRRPRHPALPRRLVALATTLALLAATTAGPALAAGGGGQVSFTQAQQYFMCTVCGEPLNVARSPEAYNENDELRLLIKQGKTIPQIKRAMVAQYGEDVLADPPKHGFAVLLVVIPAVVVAGGLVVLALTIPRWRRRAGAQAAAAASDGHAAGLALSDEDAERLAADLARRD